MAMPNHLETGLSIVGFQMTNPGFTNLDPYRVSIMLFLYHKTTNRFASRNIIGKNDAIAVVIAKSIHFCAGCMR